MLILQTKDFKGLKLSLVSFQEHIGPMDVYKQILTSCNHAISTIIIKKMSWTKRQTWFQKPIFALGTHDRLEILFFSEFP
jgi:hypothetical protein